MVSQNDGMVLVYVPAGEFTMGADDSGFIDAQPVHIVYLDAFWIDQTEITNAMYARCVEAEACEPPSHVWSNVRASYYENSRYDNYPVVFVDWYRADAYCKWAGRRLSTEAEWEKAARSIDGRQYPWGGNLVDCTLVNSCGCSSDTTAVGTFLSGASPYGALDMAGNAWEWVADWYNEYYYANSQGQNPLGPSTGEFRILRGGSWGHDTQRVSVTYRRAISPTDGGHHIGLRCALSD